MPSLLDDPEAYAFAAQLAEDERKKLGLQSLLGGIGGLLEAPVSYVKERATALATDPIGDMKRTMQGTIDRAKQREQLQQIAYGDPQNPTRVTDQAAADQLAQDYLDMASTIMPAGMNQRLLVLVRAHRLMGMDTMLLKAQK
jgi:alkylation response protein AidB-like acyl-CoA dehydrogenase